VRDAGEAVTAGVNAATNAVACAGTVAKGAALGSFLPVIGNIVGGFLGGFLNPACHTAVNSAVEAGVNTAEAVEGFESSDGCSAPDSAPATASCASDQTPQGDAASCAVYCESLYPECFTWYFDHGCCLCKPECDGSSSGSAVDTSSGAASSTCSPSIYYDTDFYGGDIVPVTTKWADTAVPAATPDDCCQACSLYDFCNAWTWTAGAGNCRERFPNAPGCCFLKKGTGFEMRSEPGMVSGFVDSPPAAECTLEYDTNFMNGDLQTSSGRDLVVPTISDVDCCNACAQTDGCGAW
jgi:hypothetical protein